jgi:uncharacterized protein involved in exopolysaccharide biosynthesis
MRHLPSLPYERQIERRQDAEYIAIPRPESGQAKQFSDYVQTLKRRKWWVIIPFCIIIALGMVQVVFQSPMYTAQVTLLIDAADPKIAPVQDFLPQESTPDFYNTQYQIIQGRTIVGKMVKKLHLDEQPLPEEPLVVRILNAVQLLPKQLFRDLVSFLQKSLGQTPEPVESEGVAWIRPSAAG